MWYLDDIAVRQVGELQVSAVPKWDLSLFSLAKAYESYFLIGTVMSANQTADTELTAMYKHHYNVLTAIWRNTANNH